NSESWYATVLAAVMQNSDQQQLGAADRIFSLCRPADRGMVGCVSLLLWCIWQNRNDEVWNNSQKAPDQVGRNAFDMLKEWLEVQQNASRLIAVPEEARWVKPHLGWIKCNVDCGFFANEGVTAMAVCFGDHSGLFLWL
ncbi:polynucleotidyl transferase ribonuclease H fold, partial [Trifolium medium]|nr:polynucleotidyl transferase ribonuclease H fold [Trifolium medium]